jgi:hypothetical protein
MMGISRYYGWIGISTEDRAELKASRNSDGRPTKASSILPRICGPVTPVTLTKVIQ